MLLPRVPHARGVRGAPPGRPQGRAPRALVLRPKHRGHGRRHRLGLGGFCSRGAHSGVPRRRDGVGRIGPVAGAGRLARARAKLRRNCSTSSRRTSRPECCASWRRIKCASPNSRCWRARSRNVGELLVRLERRTVSRKTPNDGRPESAGAAARKRLRPRSTEIAGTRTAARLGTMECTCRGADNPHVHYFIESPAPALASRSGTDVDSGFDAYGEIVWLPSGLRCFDSGRTGKMNLVRARRIAENRSTMQPAVPFTDVSQASRLYFARLFCGLGDSAVNDVSPVLPDTHRRTAVTSKI